MSLLDERFENFAIQNVTQEDDGLGMEHEVLTDGEIFLGAAVLKSSTQALIAYQQGYRQIYALLHKGIELHKEDKVKHLKSGVVYRITSDSRDMKPPDSSSLDFAQATCEVVDV